MHRPRQCVILSGGLGTRLGSLVEGLPKPMLPIQGQPFLEHLVRTIRPFGFDSFIFLAGYRSEKIAQHFAARGKLAQELGVQFRVVVEPEPSGTGGALKLAGDVLEKEFLLCNGDSLFDFNVLDLAARPFPEGALARLALRRMSDSSRFGTVKVQDEYITAFLPGLSESKDCLINGGVYWMKAAVLNSIADKSSLEKDVFPRLAAEKRLLGVSYDGFFIDIGVPSEYQLAQSYLPEIMRRPAVFFDRDGVLNTDSGYTHKPVSFKWTPGAKSAIKFFNDKRYLVFVVTNQSGVARGYYDENTVHRLHNWMQEELRQVGAHVDAFRYCPHHIEGTVAAYSIECDCRKPQPGMIVDLLRHWPVRSECSILIGDKPSDLAAANAAGIRPHHFIGGDLEEFVRSIGVSSSREAF